MDFATALTIQTWAMYAVGVLLVLARIASRYILEGSFLKLWAEEYIMVFVLANYTTFSWAIPQIAIYGSNYMSPEAAAALTPLGIKQAVWGSKMTLVVEMTTLATIWSCKGCLCLMFYRLTIRRRAEHIAVTCIAVYCAIAYVLINIMYLAYWCQPFDGYWAVPVKDSQCATYYHHMIFATSFNILADLMLLAVPLRLLPKLQVPLKRKAVVLAVLSLGVFNILAAILNRYYNFAHPDSLEYTKWYVGEVGTSVYVVNIPACWPLLRKAFRLGAWSGNSTAEPISGNESHPFPLKSWRDSKGGTKSMTVGPPRGSSESEENLTGLDDAQWVGRIGAVPPSTTAKSVAFAQAPHELHAVPGDTEGIVKTVEVSQFEVHM